MQKYFEHNILPLKDKLFRIALRITASRPEAEDVVQDVMLRMWNMRDQWDTIANKDAYCCMAARNIALGRIELKDNQKGRSDSAEINISDENTPSGLLETMEAMELLRKFIARLPKNEKAVMELRDIEGMSYNEIAAALEMTDGQVKVNLYRARQKIKGFFDNVYKTGNN